MPSIFRLRSLHTQQHGKTPVHHMLMPNCWQPDNVTPLSNCCTAVTTSCSAWQLYESSLPAIAGTTAYYRTIQNIDWGKDPILGTQPASLGLILRLISNPHNPNAPVRHARCIEAWPLLLQDPAAELLCCCCSAATSAAVCHRHPVLKALVVLPDELQGVRGHHNGSLVRAPVGGCAANLVKCWPSQPESASLLLLNGSGMRHVCPRTCRLCKLCGCFQPKTILQPSHPPVTTSFVCAPAAVEACLHRPHPLPECCGLGGLLLPSHQARGP